MFIVLVYYLALLYFSGGQVSGSQVGDKKINFYLESFGALSFVLFENFRACQLNILNIIF